MKTIMLILVSIVILTGCGLDMSMSPPGEWDWGSNDETRNKYITIIKVRTESGNPCTSAGANIRNNSFYADTTGSIYAHTYLNHSQNQIGVHGYIYSPGNHWEGSIPFTLESAGVPEHLYSN